jgi:hypothetical protein
MARSTARAVEPRSVTIVVAWQWTGSWTGSDPRCVGRTRLIRRLDAGFANIGDVQFLPGHWVFPVDTPGVQRLTDLPRHRRLRFLADMDLLGEAVE